MIKPFLCKLAFCCLLLMAPLAVCGQKTALRSIHPDDNKKETAASSTDSTSRKLVDGSVLEHTNFVITDQLHGKSIKNNGGHNGKAGMGDNDGTNAYKWIFEKAPEGDWYYIKNLASLNEPYLVAGINFDGKVYGQNRCGFCHADQWKVTAVTGYDGSYWIENRRHHGKYLASGDHFDGNLYLTDSAYASKAWWSLPEVGNIGGTGTSFNVVSEKVMLVQYQTGTTIATKPDTIDHEVIVNHSPTIEVTKPVHFSKSYLASSTLTVSTSTTTSVEQSISITVGGDLWGVSATSTTTTGTETTDAEENSSTSEETITVASESEIVCPPRTRCEMAFKMTIVTKDIPWVATVLRTYGDGTYETLEVSGTWQGVLFTNKHTEFTSTELSN